ncbi:MAG: outer membrane lipoprotein-sorting protein [Bacteroidales bacterium]|nr:outer membrane lipoprotein-sorting protein [Bacteroidales bacterium]
MKVILHLAITAIGLLFGMGVCCAQSNDIDVNDIIRKANHMALYQGVDGKGKVTLVITDKQGRTRKREFNMLRRDEGESDMDQKYFVFFHEPADIRKMVFMVHKHAEPGRDDDRWLYMPSLDLVKRIAASDKRTSFVGSDFLYEDISGRNPTEDTHELITTTDMYYVLKNVPKNRANVEFEYYVAHIDKKTFLPMKIEYFKKDNRLYRVLESMKVTEIEADEDGTKVKYPTVFVSVAKDLENGSKSEMTFSNVKYNIGLDDGIFSERYLRRPPKDAMQ